ncbi:aminophospholipid-translocating P4-type ATPase NEO1 [Aspergillus clavatus NRRL 1]|uniref:Phospholipid-transporting ATPase n=1 Tax=Aspergillus clavatus (strain ATCC 1007 / CBS 513.65 / DSM 816 / NCTC 3887 / NRRL 1 / QM 1276 / 107) TaxID=344612 RepID=A1CME1_ASPCL|nr:phospholipid-translocating P-type ATPase, putative [Aspergillus clavatus NRRL 1]EAW08728.1 phospholipid-translocating P-type ATPase, putative [Aspergillus clavatus NRRL 1]
MPAMPSSSDYLQPHDGASVDSGSDDDLDLEELDPTTATFHQAPHIPRDEATRKISYGSGIALRNLRIGGGSRWKHSNRASGEDTHGLLEDRDEETLRRSHASSHNYTEDDAPLLANRRRSSARSLVGDPAIRQRVGSARFFGFKAASVFSRLSSWSRRSDNDDNANKPPREVFVAQTQRAKYPPNVVSNAKYTPWSFLPRTLYNEFSFFFNIYFLLVALSQIIPVLRIGYMSSYIAPLAFVVAISLGKEALDDIGRRRRDAEANSEEFTVVSFDSPMGRKAYTATSIDNSEASDVFEITKKSRDLKVGDVLKVRKNQRLPADVVILKSISNDPVIARASSLAESPADPMHQASGDVPAPVDTEPSSSTTANEDHLSSGSDTFIRTDQLDGETDWKLRLPSVLSQSLRLNDFTRLKVTASAPDKRVNEFVGTIELGSRSGFYDPHVDKAQPGGEASNESQQANSAPLTIDNTAWANTVLASNTATYAVIIYTGSQTRAALSTSPSRSKVGLLEYEINNLTKILCALTLTLSVILVALEGFQPTNDKKWYIAIMIYLILFSTIIPMSLRVNLDMAKSVYSRFIQRDTDIPGTVVRTSTIPEDLGRIEYLLSDKTGTLTQNEMELKKIHVGTVSYANDAMEEVASFVRQGFAGNTLTTPSAVFGAQAGFGAAPRTRREIGSRVRDIILALALCHNVTPTMDEEDGVTVTSYQASSPDEIAIVKYTEDVGLKLSYRDRQTIVLEATDTSHVVVRVRILDIFPFTSESKRMGIIVQFETDNTILESTSDDGEIWFYQKGADTVMSAIVAANDWLDEETANMAREGLRTLVIGRKRLSSQQFQAFSTKYKQAALALQGRDVGMAKVVSEHLERDLELLGVTGVEDRLQRDVKPSLELLRNAGVKIWMLTGDKVETARCVAISAKLVARGQYIHTVSKVKDRAAAQEALDFLRNKTDCCLLIDGESLSLMLGQFRSSFISVAVLLPAVIACRCSPTQKAEVADLIRQYTKKRVCCIGDGGNDVSMIQAADVGIGIVGKEGRQASLAADFSITQFHHLTKLLVWHGRNSYKRSAKLAQFIMHRGLIISACQTMYSIASHFDPKGLFINWLMVGYATVYTNAPVFSLVFDRDVDEHLANLYPELYKELKSGRSLSYRSFFIWVLVSVYQGAVIQGLSQILLHTISGPRLISVSFTALIINELLMVAIAITTWHPLMIFCLIGTALVYAASVPFLGDYFDLEYVITVDWVWRVIAVCAVSVIPVWAGKLIQQSWKPPSYRKVRG